MTQSEGIFPDADSCCGISAVSLHDLRIAKRRNQCGSDSHGFSKVLLIARLVSSDALHTLIAETLNAFLEQCDAVKDAGGDHRLEVVDFQLAVPKPNTASLLMY